jgi:hypothetical protein
VNDWQPPYLALHRSGEMQERAARALELLAQYYPSGRTHEFEEIHRHLYRSEFERALELADELGLRRLDPRSRAAVSGLA